MTTQDILQCFLYMLIRDYVQPGDIGKILQDIDTALKQNEVKEFCYTNKHLAAYANDIIARLYSYEKNISEKDINNDE